MLACQLACIPLVVGQRQQEHFAGDKAVALLLRFLVGLVQQARQLAPDLHIAVMTADGRQLFQRVAGRLLQRRHLDAGPLQQGARGTVLLFQQGRQQVQGIDILIVAAYRQTLRVGQRFLKLGRKFVDTHLVTPDLPVSRISG